MTEMSPQQAKAYDAFRAWFAAWTPHAPMAQLFWYLGGYAGSGKTTIAKWLADVVGRVVFCAFTGKAALVLRQKGCPGARTIHSLIYKPTGESSGAAVTEAQRAYDAALKVYQEAPTPRLRAELDELERALAKAKSESDTRPGFRLNEASDARFADLIVVDECSMVDDRLGRDLLSFKKPILVLGDPAQLPPVMGEGFFTSRKPDFMLTEIHRQARESGILRLATRVREGGKPRIGEDDAADVTVVDSRSSSTLRDLALRADQVLVGRNATRHMYNARLRQLAGRSGTFPTKGDRLVCLRNEQPSMYDPEAPVLLNGSLWEAAADARASGDRVALSLRSLDEERPDVSVVAHAKLFSEPDAKLGFERREASEFQYGYALTVHKSQGSQWPRVYVVDQSSSFGAEARRHLYTAVTRASSHLTVVV